MTSNIPFEMIPTLNTKNDYKFMWNIDSKLNMFYFIAAYLNQSPRHL